MSPATKKPAAKKTDDAPAETTEKKPAGKSSKITRSDQGTWWCPVCDHSNTVLTDTCGGCGAQRDGDSVKAA